MVMKSDRLTIIIEKGNKRMIARTPITGVDKLVFVVNHQFTNAPNTTQIASGAGRSSAAGNNAAIKSPNTQQQQSVGAGGTAKNKWLKAPMADFIMAIPGPEPVVMAKKSSLSSMIRSLSFPEIELTPRLRRWQAAVVGTVRAERTPQLKVQEPNSSMPSGEQELL